MVGRGWAAISVIPTKAEMWAQRSGIFLEQEKWLQRIDSKCRAIVFGKQLGMSLDTRLEPEPCNNLKNVLSKQSHMIFLAEGLQSGLWSADACVFPCVV